MMDANGDRSDPHFHTFLQETVLHDAVAHFSPNLKEPSTYINGKKILDYILVTEELLAAGTRAGHTEFMRPFISDHCGVYFDINSDILFDKKIKRPPK